MENKQNSNNNAPTNSTTTTVVSTQIPGVDNSQVIASQPYLIKENSSKPEHPQIKPERG